MATFDPRPNGGRRIITFTLSTIVAVFTIGASALSGISYIVGYRTASGDVAMLLTLSTIHTSKLAATDQSIAVIQRDIDYIKQIVAELKLVTVPKR